MCVCVFRGLRVPLSRLVSKRNQQETDQFGGSSLKTDGFATHLPVNLEGPTPHRSVPPTCQDNPSAAVLRDAGQLEHVGTVYELQRTHIGVSPREAALGEALSLLVAVAFPVCRSKQTTRNHGASKGDDKTRRGARQVFFFVFSPTYGEVV